MAQQLTQRSGSAFKIPIFLAPAFSVSASTTTTRSFSSSPSSSNQVNRGNRDKNKKRGLSVIRSTGPRQTLSVQKLGPLPKPVADPTEARAAFETNPDHGLWGFFSAGKEVILPPSEEDSHGRAWTMQELARKSLEDLHKLYWVCVKEVNVVRTRNNERKRLRVGYGVVEAEEKIQIVQKTMLRIRKTLIARHYTYFDARRLIEERNIYELFPDVLRDEMDKAGLFSESSEQVSSQHEEPSPFSEDATIDPEVPQANNDKPSQQRQPLVR